MTTNDTKTFGRNRAYRAMDDAPTPPTAPPTPAERQRERAAAVPLRTRAEVLDALDATDKELRRLDGELTAARRAYRDAATLSPVASDDLKARARAESLAGLRSAEQVISGNIRTLSDQLGSLVTGLDSTSGHTLTSDELSRAATLRPFIADTLAASSPGDVASHLRGVVLRGDKAESFAWSHAVGLWRKDRPADEGGPAIALIDDAVARLRETVRDRSLDPLTDRARSLNANLTTAQSTIRHAGQARGEVPAFLSGVIEPAADNAAAGDGYGDAA